jgi:hypothetical protein
MPPHRRTLACLHRRSSDAFSLGSMIQPFCRASREPDGQHDAG